MPRKEVKLIDGKKVIAYHLTSEEMLENENVITAMLKYEKRGVKFDVKQNGDEHKEAYTLLIQVPEKPKLRDRLFGGKNKSKDYPRLNSYYQNNGQINLDKNVGYQDRRYGNYGMR